MQYARHHALYLEDGVLDNNCKLTPQQVLTRHDAGVYTTALITPEGMVIDWPLHRDRLLGSIEILNTRPSRPFQSLLSSLDGQGSSLSEFYEIQLRPAVKAALAAFYTESPPSRTPSQTCTKPQSQVQPRSFASDQARSVVLDLEMPTGTTTKAKSVAAEPRALQQQEAPGTDPRNRPPTPLAPQHAMLLVCISPPLPPPAPTDGRTASGCSTNTAATGSNGVAASGTATASAAAGTVPRAAAAAHPFRGGAQGDGDGGGDAGRCSGHPGGHFTNSVGWGGGGARSPHVRIAVYCKAVQPPPYGPGHAVQAAVLGRPRSLPGAKAASWVVERRQYEEHKPAEAAEVLLSDVSGRIVEGLVTNFAVIAITPPTGRTATQPTTTHPASTSTAKPDGSGPLSTPPSTGTRVAPPDPTPSSARAANVAPNAMAIPIAAVTTRGSAEGLATAASGMLAGEDVVLQVCGPQADAALLGVVQARVVQAAQRLGLRVVPEPPLAAERHTWREAFISNCIKRIQPLSRVFCPPGNGWGTEPWDCWLPHPAGPYTSALLRELELIEERIPWSDL